MALICLGVLAVQQREISELKRALEKLQPPSAPAAAVDESASQPAGSTAATAVNGQDEIRRLRSVAQELAPKIASLEGMRRENDQLRQELADESALSEEYKELSLARARAQSIQCVNNLKQLGLAARVWGTDHDDMFPPSVLAMSNEIASPKVLICPSDADRQPVANWSSFTAAHASYEFLAPSSTDTEPNRIMFRCGIHGNVTLCDGSVQRDVAKDHPERLVNRGGVLYLDNPMEATPAASRNLNMPPEMMKRYGLTPAPEPSADPAPNP